MGKRVRAGGAGLWGAREVRKGPAESSRRPDRAGLPRALAPASFRQYCRLAVPAATRR